MNEMDTDKCLITEEQLQSADYQFLLGFLGENLNQARHVENERMMFVTLFAALVGGVLAIVADIIASRFFASVIILLLIALNTLCYVLTKRWNEVFTAHWQTAKRITCYLTELKLGTGIAPESITDEFVKTYPLINRYFCFDNSMGKARPQMYIHTAQLFSLFNYCIYVLLLVALVFVNIQP